MGNITPRKLALLAAFITLLGIYFNHWIFKNILFKENAGNLQFITAIATAFVVYEITLIVLRTFIIDRIRHIYALIYKPGDNPEIKTDKDKPLLKEVEDEVTLYIKSQNQEMNSLRHLERYRQDYVGNVAHELKTPTFNVQGYVHTLLDGALDDPSVNTQYLQKASDNIDRMIKIIEDLDSVYKIESGLVKVEITSLDLDQFIQTMIDEVSLIARDRSVTITKSSAAGIFVKADADYLRQVFINLLENSIKYGKIGGETIIKVKPLDENVLIEIMDNGVGIEPRHLRHIFDRFYRVDKGRSRQAGGSGLGLSIVKHILEAHGQNIQVRSIYGQGSTFSFTLDRATGEDD